MVAAAKDAVADGTIADPAVARVLANRDLMRAVETLRRRLNQRGMSISINGADGSGKSTLCQQIMVITTVVGMPTRYLHVHHWYSNLFAIPWLLFYNRYMRRELLIFDRSIVDNLSVLFVSLPRRFLCRAAVVVNLFYPRFSCCFYLSAPLDELLRRRPNEDPVRLQKLIDNYGILTALFGHIELQSDATLLENTLGRMTHISRA